jgi:hypothetical protein
MPRKPRTRAYHQWNADWYGQSAAAAAARGEGGRTTLLFEHALDFQLCALDLALREQSLIEEDLGAMYLKAARYAIACGRRQKARHLLRQLQGLALTPSQQEEALALQAEV